MRPELCIILGGSERREVAALKACQKNFNGLPIWLSSPDLAKPDIFELAAELEIELSLIRIDHHAIDIISSFTTLIKDINRGGFKNVTIFTSKYQMARVKAVAEIMLGRYKLKTHIVAISLENELASEGVMRVWRDKFRAYVWVYFDFDFGPMIMELMNKKVIEDMKKKVTDYSHFGAKAHTKPALM